MGARLSIIVSTLGRPHLARTLRSIAEQQPDEIIVVADLAGNLDHAERVADNFGAAFYTEVSNEYGRGNAQKTFGITQAQGTHIAFMDDDDSYLPGAIDAMRERATDRPVIFRMEVGPCVLRGVNHPNGVTLWKRPVLEYANVGTPCFLVPNDPNRLGEWVPHVDCNGGDFTFITGCAEKMGGVWWDDRVVCKVRS